MKYVNRIFDDKYLHELFSQVHLKSDEEVYSRKIVAETIFNSAQYGKLVVHIHIYREEDNTAHGFISFNPNKVFQSSTAHEQVKSFLKLTDYCKIARCDIAIDIPYNMIDLTPIKGRKKMRLIDSDTGYTVYWGTRNNKGSSKLY